MNNYFFTFTIKPIWYSMLPKAQLRFTASDLLELLKPFKSTIICELTKDLNLHYHAKIALDNKGLKQLLLRCKNKEWYKKFGHKDYSIVQDEEKVNEYLKKDNMTMLTEYDIDGVLKDDFNIIDPSIIRQLNKPAPATYDPELDHGTQDISKSGE